MNRSIWFVKLLERLFPHRFALARLTRIPVVSRITDRLLFEGDDLIYLPQDRVIPVSQALDRPGEMVLPSQVVEHFIEKANHQVPLSSSESPRCPGTQGNSSGPLFSGSH